jgi:hypothetical protein
MCVRTCVRVCTEGLPSNADKCHETRTTPAAACGHCGADVQTNFLAVMTPEGQTVPWIVSSDTAQKNLCRHENAEQAAQRLHMS